MSVDFSTLIRFDEYGAHRVGVQRVVSELNDRVDLLVAGEKDRVDDKAKLAHYDDLDALAAGGEVPAILAELIRYANERNTRIAYGLGRSAAMLHESEHQIWEMFDEPAIPMQIGSGQTIREAFESAQLYAMVSSISID